MFINLHRRLPKSNYICGEESILYAWLNQKRVLFIGVVRNRQLQLSPFREPCEQQKSAGLAAEAADYSNPQALQPHKHNKINSLKDGEKNNPIN